MGIALWWVNFVQVKLPPGNLLWKTSRERWKMVASRAASRGCTAYLAAMGVGCPGCPAQNYLDGSTREHVYSYKMFRILFIYDYVLFYICIHVITYIYIYIHVIQIYISFLWNVARPGSDVFREPLCPHVSYGPKWFKGIDFQLRIWR